MLEAKAWAKATLWTAAAAFTGFIAAELRVKLHKGMRQQPLRFIQEEKPQRNTHEYDYFQAR